MSKKQSSMSDYLLVPTNLQAFLVGERTADWLYDLAPVPREEDDVPDWYRDRKYSFSVPPSTLKSKLEAGVHLHWALPAALMHSRHEGGNKPAQPCIPNRWLVLRMWHAAGNSKISSKAWVIESDYVSPDADSGGTPFPFFGSSPPSELENKHVGYVGRTVPLDGWKEKNPKYRFDLRSHGWGDPSFAAYYPACKGVLGFHDKMDGVNKGDLLTYLVIGWYSDPDKDPLHTKWKPSHAYGVGDIVTPSKPNGHQYRVTAAGTSGSAEPSWPTTGSVTPGPVVYAENGADVLAGSQWSCSNLDAAALPLRTLCHGGGVGVTWQGPDHPYPAEKPVGGANTAVAIGGSAAEALAALLEPGQKSRQQVLCAFQHGQATQVSESYQLGDLLHRHGFGAAPGGKHWSIEPVAEWQSGHAYVVGDTVRPTTPNRHQYRVITAGTSGSSEPSWPTAGTVTNGTVVFAENGADVPAGAKSTLRPVSAEVQVLLGKLNEAQQALDWHARELESLRSRLFDCWATWASKQGAFEGTPSPRNSVDPAAKIVADASKKLGAYGKAVRERKADVLTALTAEKSGMQLAESTTQPFLHPKDPFVALRGEKLVGVDRAHSHRSDENANGALRCRLVKNVVTGVKLQGTSSKAWRAADLQLDFPSVTATPLADEVVRSLALETLLFDSNCTKVFITGTKDESLLKLFEALQQSLAQSRESSGDKLTWDGEPPDPLGITRWGKHNPWLPVYLMWQVRWAPTYTPGKGSDSHSGALAGWQLDPDPVAGDLAGSVQPKKKEVLLTGATIISALSGIQLAKNLTEFAKTAGLKGDFGSIKQTQFLGQSLGGLNDLLLRQTLGLFLPPFDPTNTLLDAPVWDALNQVPQPVMPVTGTFLPVRVGALRFVYLWIVDSFGQTRKLIDSSTSSSPQSKVIASAALRPPADYDAGFSPRLVQPARLNFAWQPADAAASGPLCGWIIPNFLDKSFAVFSAGGEPLGALESLLPVLGEKTTTWHENNGELNVKFKWRPIPGSTLKIEEIGNLRLRRFVDLVKKFSPDEGQAFLELVELVLRRTEGRVPAEDPALAVLLGRPLALVHASLGLELQGLPAGYWNTDVEPWTFETEGFEKLRVPVRLGGMKLSADGLVGYLPENDECLFASEGAVQRIDASRNASRSLIQYQHNQGKKELTVACDGPPVLLTLLMDASARVHATTGILPRHSVALPPEAAHLAGLIDEIYFGVAPVLGPSASQPTMPRPSDAFGQWSWATRPDLTAKIWHDIQPADDRARFANDLALTEGWLRLRLKQNQGASAQANPTTGTKP